MTLRERGKLHVDTLRQRGPKSSRRVPPDDSPYSCYGAYLAARRRVWDGIDVHPVVELDDGTIGYASDPARVDDCLRPAIATVTQIPIEEVPDPRLDLRLMVGEDPDAINVEAWEELIQWAKSRGLQITLHETVPVPHDRWIGVVDTGVPGHFNTHCLTMNHDELLFDPACSIRPPPLRRRWIYGPDDISVGLTLDPDPDGKDI